MIVGMAVFRRFEQVTRLEMENQASEYSWNAVTRQLTRSPAARKSMVNDF